jgi:hypothetical protein
LPTFQDSAPPPTALLGCGGHVLVRSGELSGLLGGLTSQIGEPVTVRCGARPAGILGISEAWVLPVRLGLGNVLISLCLVLRGQRQEMLLQPSAKVRNLSRDRSHAEI